MENLETKAKILINKYWLTLLLKQVKPIIFKCFQMNGNAMLKKGD